MKTEFLKNEIFAGMYQILQEIGRGGAGIVYLAYHLRLEKYVVVKRIQTRYGSEAVMRAEADILKNLHHPCLPQVYDYFCDADEVFTVMDYIEGEDLGRGTWFGRGLPEQQLLEWLRQLAGVLDYLHTREIPILHSDIKPSNIILRPDGSVCLIDFNISLVADADAAVRGFSEQYASPEQIRLAECIRAGQKTRETLDARTDIYSLGATFYTLITGCLPSGRYVSQPLREMPNLGYSQPFLEIIDRCMAWDPRRRYQSAAKLLDAIRNMRRLDSRYRGYVRRKVASLLLCGVLAAAGAFCLVHGLQERNSEDYRDAYAAFAAACEQNDYDSASLLGRELLNDPRFERILSRQQMDEALILHAMGDADYDAGNFAGASEWYSRALTCARSGGGDLSPFYRDYAIALAKSDRADQAEQVLAQAETDGADGPSLRLVRLSLAISKGEYDGAAAMAEELLAGSQDAQVNARACLETSEAMNALGKPEEAISWLERAVAYSPGRRMLRELGERCIQLANSQHKNSQSRIRYAAQALSSYDQLEAQGTLTQTDYINRSIAQIAAGRKTEAVNTLLKCREQWGASFAVDMNLAFAYDALEDDASARRYCSSALSEYSKLQPAEKDRFAADYENLRQLAEALG